MLLAASTLQAGRLKAVLLISSCQGDNWKHSKNEWTTPGVCGQGLNCHYFLTSWVSAYMAPSGGHGSHCNTWLKIKNPSNVQSNVFKWTYLKCLKASPGPLCGAGDTTHLGWGQDQIRDISNVGWEAEEYWQIVFGIDASTSKKSLVILIHKVKHLLILFLQSFIHHIHYMTIINLLPIFPMESPVLLHHQKTIRHDFEPGVYYSDKCIAKHLMDWSTKYIQYGEK